MLPIENRLKKKKDFERIFEEGVTMKNSCFFLRLVKNELNITRVGFIVSKKVSRKAVERNRIKRLFREIVRLKMSEIKPGLDMVFIVLSNSKEKSFLELKQEIERILEKINTKK